MTRAAHIRTTAPGNRRFRISCILGAIAVSALSPGAHAETISHALARAYVANPDLRQQRASVRAVDENVPKARAGYLPKASANAFLGYEHDYAYGLNPQAPSGQTSSAAIRGYSAKATETIFDGFKTLYSVRQAQSQVFAAREALRTAEQNVLLNAATAYMDFLRDSAILELRRRNIDVLSEQLRETRGRFAVGEVTRTDVAQTEASLAQGKSDLANARAAWLASAANYRRYIGDDPHQLEPARPLDGMIPGDVEQAIEIGLRENPAVGSAIHNLAVAHAAVKIAESALYPTASVTGQTSRFLDYNGFSASSGFKLFSATVTGQIDAPIYQGGAEYAAIRQAKEQVSQAKFAVQSQSDSIRAQVVAAWSKLVAARATIESDRAAESAAQQALNGIREEARVGQRTTFDVLTAHQTLLAARVALVSAQHDRVVASYAALAAIGRLSATQLRLYTATYDPASHFHEVEHKLVGVSIR